MKRIEGTLSLGNGASVQDCKTCLRFHIPQGTYDVDYTVGKSRETADDAYILQLASQIYPRKAVLSEEESRPIVSMLCDLLLKHGFSVWALGH